MREIANTIERDIARALQPKPEKVQEDYWTIYEKDCFGSYHSYKDFMSFGSYEDAESFLLRDKTIVKAEQKYADRRFFDDGVIFQSKKRYMSDVPDDEQIPVLYSIHHCYYDHYPYNADVLEMIAKRVSVNASRKIWKSLKRNMPLKTGLFQMTMMNKRTCQSSGWYGVMTNHCALNNIWK